MAIRQIDGPPPIADRLADRCEHAGGPSFKNMGVEMTHKCVLYVGHPGTTHYCFVIDDQGQTTWFEWDQ